MHDMGSEKDRKWIEKGWSSFSYPFAIPFLSVSYPFLSVSYPFLSVSYPFLSVYYPISIRFLCFFYPFPILFLSFCYCFSVFSSRSSPQASFWVTFFCNLQEMFFPFKTYRWDGEGLWEIRFLQYQKQIIICSILDAENSSHFWYGQRPLGSAEINVSRLEYPCVSEMASLGLELGARSRLASAFSVAANTEFVFFSTCLKSTPTFW